MTDDRWPALTVRQPYAFAFTAKVEVPKRTENRGWSWAYRGPLWLHAGARSGWESAGANDPLVRAAWDHHVRQIPGWPGLPSSDVELTRKTTLMPFKAITALMQVVGCHYASACLKVDPQTRRGTRCTPWARAGQFHISIADVQARCRDGHVHFCHGGEPHARGVAARGDDDTVVRRTVTYGPWEPVKDSSDESGT